MVVDTLTDADLWISDEELDQLAVALERIVMRARGSNDAPESPNNA